MHSSKERKIKDTRISMNWKSVTVTVVVVVVVWVAFSWGRVGREEWGEFAFVLLREEVVSGKM